MQPNILVLVMDAVRAKNCSVLGYHRDTTPVLRDLPGTLYTEARAPSNWSLPSHTSIFTGIPAHKHGLHGRPRKLNDGHSIWERLNEGGYQTGVFSDNVFITTEEFGLIHGFETIQSGYRGYETPFEDAISPRECDLESKVQYLRESFGSGKPIRSMANGMATLLRDFNSVPSIFREHHSNAAQRAVEDFLAWSENSSGPWAACLNFQDAHRPYQPTPEHNHWGENPYRAYQEFRDGRKEFLDGSAPWEQISRFMDLYDGAIRQCDSAIGSIVEGLRSRDEFDDTLLIVTADHGECFGEKSPLRGMHLVAHLGGLREELIHVPLLIKAPGQDWRDSIDSVIGLDAIYDFMYDAYEDKFSHPASSPNDFVVSAADHDQRYSGEDHGMPDEYISQFEGTAYIVYDVEDGTKLGWWGDDQARFDTFHADNPVERSVPENLREQISNVPVEDIISTHSDIGDATRSRLKELGYL